LKNSKESEMEGPTTFQAKGLASPKTLRVFPGFPLFRHVCSSAPSNSPEMPHPWQRET